LLAALALQPSAIQAVRSAPASPAFSSSQVRDLAGDLARIAASHPGRAGFAVIGPDGRVIQVNGDQTFPMASTVKVVIAAYFLAEVDAGRRSLSALIPVDDRLRLRADGITFFAPFPGVALSAANLIDLMLTRSDNSATDVLMEHIGGPPVVQAWLARNRITGLRVDRTIAQLLLDRRGATAAPGQTPAEAMRRWDPVVPGSAPIPDPDTDAVPNPRFDANLRDTATPAGFARFLARLEGGELLQPASRAFLYAILSRTLTGSNRIKAGLPSGTPLLHKTGTLAGITDDIGIVILPDGRRVVLVAFVQGGSDRPALIARATRAVIADLAQPL
jgi:beta-lactamase class A